MSSSSSPYAPAAKLLNQIWTKRKGLKTVAYNREGELTCSKVAYAQCAHVLQNKPLLDRLLNIVKLDLQAKNEGLLYVLLYELLMGPNLSIRGGGSLKRQLMAHQKELQDALQKVRDEEGLNDSETCTPTENSDGQLKPSTMTIPRYVRVNTLKTNRSKIIERLQAKGMKHIFLDPHVPDLVVLPPTPETRAQLQDMVTSHQIVLQDKSSCFSALCLVHGFGNVEGDPPANYLDACAAPGNKTSHLAALLASQQQSSGSSRKHQSIHALDKSVDRYQLLKRRMDDLVGAASSSTVALKCHNLDFFGASSTTGSEKPMATDSNFRNVQAILLDPSCSGSGMTSNHSEASKEHRGDPMFCNDRVKSLADFQLKALQHATSSEVFPNVTRVVYSTCSLYKEENECVVQRFLQSQQEQDNDSNFSWTLVAPKCLAAWERRGLAVDGLTEEQSNAMIRVHPDHDASNGFFVACFEKRSKVAAKKDKMKSKRSKNKEENGWAGVTTVPGIALYNNEFHQTVVPKGTMKHEKEAAKTSQSQAEKNPVKRNLPSKHGSAVKHNKRQKVQPLSAGFESGNKEETQLSKKRSKKLEWKRKQKQLKIERLASKEMDGK